MTWFQIVAPYTLLVAFADGTEQRIDFKPVLRGTLFGPLLDPSMFEQVTLDPEVGTLVWPNGADFDPATLHDWPAVRDELIARARTWPTEQQARGITGNGADASLGAMMLNRSDECGLFRRGVIWEGKSAVWGYAPSVTKSPL